MKSLKQETKVKIALGTILVVIAFITYQHTLPEGTIGFGAGKDLMFRGDYTENGIPKQGTPPSPDQSSTGTKAK